MRLLMSLSPGARGLLSEAASWGLIAVLGALAVIYFEDIRAVTSAGLGLPAPSAGATASASYTQDPPPVSLAGAVEIRVGKGGHFHTEAEVNGRGIEVMVDTGATVIALTYEDAERAGIYLKASDFNHTVSTANGIARVAPVMLERVSVGDITVRDVRAVVSERGRLTTTLLGMSFLGRLSQFDMRPGLLILHD